MTVKFKSFASGKISSLSPKLRTAIFFNVIILAPPSYEQFMAEIQVKHKP